MKKDCITRNILLIAITSFCCEFAFAQLDTPRPSPLGSVNQKVGLNELTIEYSRPGVKDRVIFGELVPYGELWRTGANAATKITLAEDAKLGGKEIPAGVYSLFTIPGKSKWTIIINKDPNASKRDYDESKDQARFTVKPEKVTEKVETFTINIEHIRLDSAYIQLVWEHTKVSFKIETPVDEQIMAQIESAMKGVSPETYYQAAVYYYDTDKDLDQALIWMNNALEGKQTFWMLHSKAKLQAKMGDYKGAIITAGKSKESAILAGSSHYIALNEKAIAEWQRK